MSDNYTSPFSQRYSSKEMQLIFSDDYKYSTWRKLWISLAKAQMKLGLPITKEQIDELEENKDNIDYDQVKLFEKQIRHDVMSHIKAYGLQCPKAKGIIHLGATSCFVTDNTDIIIMKTALILIRKKLVSVIKNLSDFALKYKDIPTLGFTHFQPAQLVTVGKRACLWIQDFCMDVDELEFVVDTLMMRGVKGTTGTQASFMSLFNDDENKVDELERLVCEDFGFDKAFNITGQTYSRKTDSRVLKSLSSIAQSAHKMGTDIRLLQGLKEIEEPFETNQVGSSAMAYKRNPMRSERICSLARYIITNAHNPEITASVQWLERTLDDSANRRLSIAEGFLATDGMLDILINITDNLVVNENVIKKHIREEIPFIATENILMESVKRGGDRQLLHEKIRQYSLIASKRVKEEGLDNNLLELISKDDVFSMNKEDLNNILNPSKYIGRSVSQVEIYIKGIQNIFKKYYTGHIEVNLNV
ncbi:MAG: adenylosuccinate lyase [Clostridiaceae bacterium]|nr:adenylosuccinate lyase [Clostridiaceae bacterium]